MRGRLRRRGGDTGERRDEPEYVEIEPGGLAGVFAAPSWLRDLGLMAWLLVGVAAALAGAVWLLALTQTIVLPVVTAAIVASVLAPVVAWLARRGVSRGLGTVILFLLLVLLAAGVVVMVLAGIASQTDDLTANLKNAASEIEGWVKELGVSDGAAQSANADASASTSDTFHALLDGLGTGISALASLVLFLSFTALSLVYLLKDGPKIRAWESATWACRSRWPARSPDASSPRSGATSPE